LAFEEEHARRVADLRLYVRQEHAERDQAALGRFLVAADRAGEVVW
ncbi:MAG TPA: acyl-CoA dehydrogenase, partial [Intrasporangium sp.]|nr:acyl-CoA dehydrogenase [Intrasporangium sp.]